MIKNLPYLFIVFVIFQTNLQAQDHLQVDSLLMLVNNSKQDSTVSNIYLKVAKLYTNAGDFKNGALYTKQSFLHSKKISFYEGMARAKIQEAKIESDQGKNENAKSLLKEALAIRKQVNDTPGIINILLKYAGITNNSGKPFDAIKQYNFAVQLAVRSRDSVYLSRAYNNIGAIYQTQAKYTEAINFFLKSLEISEKTNDYMIMAMTIASVGSTYILLNNAPEAIRFLRKSLAISSAHNLVDAQVYGLTNMQRAFDLTGQLDSFLYYNKVSLRLMKDRNEPIIIARVENNIADAFSRLNQLDSALFYIEDAIQLTGKTENKVDMAAVLTTKAEILLKLAKHTGKSNIYNEAVVILQTATKLAEEFSDPASTSDCYLLMSEAYSGLHQYNQAYYYHLKYSQLSDSINNSTFTLQVIEMNTKYETEKKDRSIAENKVLMAKKEIELTKKSNDNRMLLAGVGGLILLVVFGSVSFTQRQKLTNRKKEIEKQKALEQTRAAIARDLHDDIGATLSSMQIMSSFASKAIQNSAPDADQWVQKIGDNTGEVLQNIRDIVWTMNPENDNAEELILRMKQFASQILEPKSISYTFSVDDKATLFLNELVAKRNVFLIFKETLNNIAKYAECDTVFITLQQNQKNDNVIFQMTISDNGKGFDSSGTFYGNGLKSIKARAEQMNGEIEIISRVTGTTVTLNCAHHPLSV
jgi:two-component system sensor histidine kinase UhpB